MTAVEVGLDRRTVEVRVATIAVTEEEAAVLQAIFSHVGGNPAGPRKVLNDITAGLERVFPGLSWREHPIDVGGCPGLVTLYVEARREIKR